MHELKLENIVKEYGDVRAVDGLSFTVESGEFFSILGPSGCGKTTTLRCITGFEDITDGTVYMQGESANSLAPGDRDVSMVFQGFALFPHKTVGENIGFGLKLDNVPKNERTDQVEEMLNKVDLPGMKDRMPDELSGGQQQRVALARALILEPSILALDEPLASLDRSLRQQMRYELKKIQQDLDVTTVYVTHDQKEALALSDRICVMNNGQVEQIGSPREIYYEPESQFVAEFIGETNIFSKSAIEPAMETTQTADAGDDSGVLKEALADGSGSQIVLRPEDITLTTPEDGFLTGTVKTKTFHGNTMMYLLEGNPGEIKAETTRPREDIYELGDEVGLTWKTDDVWFIPE